MTARAASATPGKRGVRRAAANKRVPSGASRLLAALDASEQNLVLDVDGHEVAVTHLDRVYWPAAPALEQPPITKRDFLRYLVQVATPFLAHARDRPLTLFRWPEGVAGRRVLMKHWEIRLPAFVERVRVFSESKGEPDEYILCNNLATLVWLAHMGTLEFHVWHSRVRPGPGAANASTDFTSSLAVLQRSVIEYPDYIVFDIDPFIYTGAEKRRKQPEFSEAAFDKAKRVALWLNALLDRMSLASRVKTSGKTGLHVVVPIRRTLPYEAVREIARFIGDHVMREHRDEVTVDWTIERRTGKVFIDYNMNVRAKSLTVAYSPRGLDGAPVSMPLEWDDVGRAYPGAFRIANVPARLARRGDPWAGLLDDARSLEDLLGAGG